MLRSRFVPALLLTAVLLTSAFLAAFEAEHGEVSDEQVAEAARRARARAVVVRGRGVAWRGVSLVLDAGAFLAVERADRDVVALIKGERAAGRVPVTHGGVVGQVWRGGGRQALVARLLAGVEVIALDEELGRRAGVLLGRAGSSDVVDAAVVLLAHDGDDVLTSDPQDLLALAEATGAYVELVMV